jgi:mannose-6-phosphate isomerase-like protein (cupin superfamily)
VKWISADQHDLVPASHEDPRSPGVLKRVLAGREDFQAGHVQMLNWAVLPGLSSFQPHYHEDMQEIFVIISGSVEMTVSGESRRLNSGDAVLVDPEEIHVMRNLLETEAEYLVFGVSSGKDGRTINVNSNGSC